ncbi:hypothetical protein IGI04_026586 [Brassica rapa subsp. trilocularis]|uniref:Ubiquitin-like protease family profile domain-containing protein n=1 Tax=Brassica rapa subsp. trilocularis TaxID=1813537 RepID=A0ABQ7KWG5_BRACM|nr:hypothetical protein IGI04_026586 [Brassica rapa subsp. trilocularis]
MVSARLVDCPDIPEETEMQPNPDMMFAAGEEPVGVRVLSYQSSSALKRIFNALDEGELDIIRRSSFGKLIEIADKPVFSGRFTRYMLSMQLKTKKKHEAWFRFAGKPVRFSLLEFAIVTGLPCGQFPPKSKMKLKETITEQPYWPSLFGKVDTVTVSSVIKMLYRKTVKDTEIRIKYAYSEDVDGHGRDIFCKKHTLNPAHARNVDKRIDLLVNSVLVEDPVGRINAGNLVYSDEEHDARVESMLVRISRSHRFNNSDFPSGLKKSDVDRMREVVKSTTKPKRAKKFQSNVQDSETSYIVQVVLEKIKAEVASMERNIKVATSGVEAIEQKVGFYSLERARRFFEWSRNHSNVSTKEVSVPASHSSPVADVNAMTIQNVLRDISQYSTPPRSNRMSEAGNLTPSNKAHAGSGYVCVTPVLQSCAQSANSENRSRQNSFHQRLEGRKRQPQCLMYEPSFSLGLTQKAFIPVEVPILPTNQVHHQEPIADINVGDNNEEGQSSWRSKRQKTVPSGLRCIFVIQDISEQTRKYAKLVTKLQGKFVFNILGLAVSAKELLLIVDRPRTYSAKVFDILIRVLRSVMSPLLPPQGSRSDAFLDTKFVPSIMRTFPKFLKSKNKEEAPMLHPTRYYFPLNVANKHWIGIRFDAGSGSIIILDCNLALHKDATLEKIIKPVVQMLPYLARYACQPLGAEPVIQCYDVARPKSVAQSKVPVDSGLMALLMMAYHALYGLDACKTITRELLEEEGKSEY